MAKLFDGTSAVTASILNKDIVDDFLTSHDWSYGEARMEFYPLADMTISLNGSNPIFVGVGDEIEEDEIWSLVLLEADKNYTFYAMYDTKLVRN